MASAFVKRYRIFRLKNKWRNIYFLHLHRSVKVSFTTKMVGVPSRGPAQSAITTPWTCHLHGWHYCNNSALSSSQQGTFKLGLFLISTHPHVSHSDITWNKTPKNVKYLNIWKPQPISEIRSTERSADYYYSHCVLVSFCRSKSSR